MHNFNFLNLVQKVCHWLVKCLYVMVLKMLNGGIYGTVRSNIFLFQRSYVIMNCPSCVVVIGPVVICGLSNAK